MRVSGKNINIHYYEDDNKTNIDFINISDKFLVEKTDIISTVCSYYLDKYENEAITEQLLKRGIDELDPYFESEETVLETYRNIRNETIKKILDK